MTDIFATKLERYLMHLFFTFPLVCSLIIIYLPIYHLIIIECEEYYYCFDFRKGTVIKRLIIKHCVQKRGWCRRDVWNWQPSPAPLALIGLGSKRCRCTDAGSNVKFYVTTFETSTFVTPLHTWISSSELWSLTMRQCIM